MTDYGKSSKFFLLTLVFITMLSLYMSFYKFYIKEDYYVMAQVECDPSSESCFRYSWCEDGECEEEYPYKVIYRISSSIPACGKGLEPCEELSCDLINDNNVCVEYLCDPEIETCY